MLESYLTLAGTEVANHTRLQSYIDNGLVLGYDHLEACGCEAFSPASVGAVYVAPDIDPAPWYDAGVPESAEFAGLLVLSMTGADDRPTSRSVSQSVTGGGVFGRQRVLPRTIVVQGVLLGTSCCGVAYGLKWLGQALDGCPGGGCDGADLLALDCCPPTPEQPEPTGGWDSGFWDDGVWDDSLYITDFAAYLRTMRRAALVSGPTVTRRAGSGCGGGCTADVIFVEFVLSGAEPWWWKTPVEVLSEFVPTDAGECIDWTLVATGEGCPTEAACCRLAACSGDETCSDPNCAVPTPPTVGLPDSCFCLPIAVNSECFALDTSSVPTSFEAVPVITVTAGSSDLRRVTVTFYESDGDCCAEADGMRCDPVATYHVGYLQAGATMVFDGQIRRAQVTCDGQTMQASDAWGAGGAPVEYVPLGCDRSYCVVIEADAIATPAADATVTIALSGREY